MITKHSFFGKICLIAFVICGPLFTEAQVTPPAPTPPPPATPVVRVRPVAGPRVPPAALRNDIKVELVMTIEPKAIRLLYDESTGSFYYTCYDGDVYKIKNFGTKQASSEKMFTVQDHGIPRLQGGAIYKNNLFLSGNTKVNNGLGNGGRMVRYKLNATGKAEMSIVFTTVEYATNQLNFDHGWNGGTISPDGKYIYQNSGSRTDHGEVQDNLGRWPNARIGNFTARIFRFPTDARDLLLPDDDVKLKAAGYVYAEGIRNAFDMSFDGKGILFAVSNSPDYDMPEDMFWVRQGHHYGFPWVAGGIEMPQQYNDYQPDPKTDPFIPASSSAWTRRLLKNDPGFPQKPEGVKFSPGVQNLGPDANEYRGHSGKIQDGDQTAQTVSTFTPHASPLGLVFDTKNVLSPEFKGDGFVLRYSKGGMMGAFTKEGSDMLHLDMAYNKLADNYYVKTTRIVDSFKEPIDAVMIGNTIYVMEYGATGGNIWKVTLPKDTKASPVAKSTAMK